MICEYHVREIPSEQYCSVPKGWYAAEIIAYHRQLGGTFDLSNPTSRKPDARVCSPEQWERAEYRKTLYRIADGILLVNDPACAELAIQYIELRYIGFCSGYLRALFARRLKHATLDVDQKARLHIHFSTLVAKRDYSWEFREYVRLWRSILASPELEQRLVKLREKKHTKGQEWLLGEMKVDAVMQYHRHQCKECFEAMRLQHLRHRQKG
jgi:hypothetical protein